MNEIKYEDLPRSAARPVEGYPEMEVGVVEGVRFHEGPRPFDLIMPETNPFDAVAEEVLNKEIVLRAIDYLRPDWALLRGLQAQHNRRNLLTEWRPARRTPRTPGKYRAKAAAGRYHRARPDLAVRH